VRHLAAAAVLWRLLLVLATVVLAAIHLCLAAPALLVLVVASWLLAGMAWVQVVVQ
jgi:hypothetical protein